MFKSIYFKIIVIILVVSAFVYFGNNYYIQQQKRISIASFVSFKEPILKDYDIRISLIDGTDFQYLFSTGDVAKVNLVSSYNQIIQSLKEQIINVEKNRTDELNYIQKKLVDNYNVELNEVNKLNKDAQMAECMFKSGFTVNTASPFQDSGTIDKQQDSSSVKSIKRQFLSDLRPFKPCINNENTRILYIDAENYLLNMVTFFGGENFVLDNGDKSREFFFEYNKLHKLYIDSFGYKLSRENSSANLKILTLTHKQEVQSLFDEIISKNNLHKNLITGMYE